jgi:hypothetical protein
MAECETLRMYGYLLTTLKRQNVAALLRSVNPALDSRVAFAEMQVYSVQLVLR